MKKTIIILLLSFIGYGVSAQTIGNMPYDSIKVGRSTGLSGTNLWGRVYLSHTPVGSGSTDSILTILNKRVRKVATLPISKVTGLQTELDSRVTYTGATSTVNLGAYNIKSNGASFRDSVRVEGNYTTTINRHAFEDYSRINLSTGTTEGYASIDLLPQWTGSGRHSHYAGIQVRPYFGGSIGLNDYLYGVRIFPTYVSTDTTEKYTGLLVEQPTGSGVINQKYGIKVEDISGGTALNYALWTGAGGVRFGGDTYVSGGAKLFINTTSGTDLLNVNGTSSLGGNTSVDGSLFQKYSGAVKAVQYLDTRWAFQTISGYDIVFEPATVEQFRINTNGSVKISTTPTTSSGTYDILTRNTSTGLIEKISSSSTVAPFSRDAVNDTNFAYGSFPTANKVNLVAFTAMTGNRTVDIPAGSATNASTNIVIIKDESGSAGTYTITIAPASGTIDGAASKVINTAYGVLELYSNGSNWFTK